MGNNKEPRLEGHHIDAINLYLDSDAELKQKIIERFCKNINKRKVVRQDPAKMFERMICPTDPGPAAKYKMKAFWDATGLPLAAFEETVVQQKDFFAEHYKVKGILTTDLPILNRADQKKFIDFFGDSVERTDKYVTFVFPKRTLKPDQPDPFELESKKLSSEGGLPEGVCGYLAFEDVKAAIHLSNIITGITRKAVSVRHENVDTSDNNSCVIALGLAFNAATRRLEEKVRPKLFSVYVGPSPKRKSTVEKTDNFLFRHIVANDLKPVPIKKGKDIALIVRIVPGKSVAPWFIAAGRTAAGTAVAAYYLAHNWRKLYDMYPNKKALSEKSIAVVIRHDEPENEPLDIQEINHHIEKTGELHYWDNNDTIPCIAWGEYKQ